MWVAGTPTSCTDVQGLAHPSWNSSVYGGNQTASQIACEASPANYTFQPNVDGYCAPACLDGQGASVAVATQAACQITGNSWQLPALSQNSSEQSCEWQASANVWIPEVLPMCFDGSGNNISNIHAQEDCEVQFLTGTCDGATGQCQCAIGYTGYDCSQIITTPELVPEPAVDFWLTVAWLAGVAVAVPCACA